MAICKSIKKEKGKNKIKNKIEELTLGKEIEVN